jgi:hypothetical protein
MVDTKILIGVPTGEFARRADFYDYFNTLNKPPNSMIIFTHGPSPAKNRNIIIEQALFHKCTHVLFIDDDTAFDANALEQLLEHDKDIVSGLVLRREYPHQPLIFDGWREDGYALYAYLNGSNRLVPIKAAGFGFLLCKIHVFTQLQKPWIRMGELDPENWCDDIGFFRRLREAGIKDIWCDMECRIGHIGTMIVWPRFENGKWFTGYDTKGDKGMLLTPQVVPSAEMLVK